MIKINVLTNESDSLDDLIQIFVVINHINGEGKKRKKGKDMQQILDKAINCDLFQIWEPLILKVRDLTSESI